MCLFSFDCFSLSFYLHLLRTNWNFVHTAIIRDVVQRRIASYYKLEEEARKAAEKEAAAAAAELQRKEEEAAAKAAAEAKAAEGSTNPTTGEEMTTAADDNENVDKPDATGNQEETWMVYISIRFKSRVFICSICFTKFSPKILFVLWKFSGRYFLILHIFSTLRIFWKISHCTLKFKDSVLLIICMGKLFNNSFSTLNFFHIPN